LHKPPGKASVNATLMFGVVMMRAIWTFEYYTGRKIGFKAAGGVKTSKDVFYWLALVRLELGEEWLNPSLFRFGASSLLKELDKEIV
jgi:deoxyribose-phosphate aldolase